MSLLVDHLFLAMHSLFGYIFCTVVIELDPKARIENQHFFSSPALRVYWRFLLLFMATFILLLVQKKTRTNKPEVVTADKIDYKMPWFCDKV